MTVFEEIFNYRTIIMYHPNKRALHLAMYGKNIRIRKKNIAKLMRTRLDAFDNYYVLRTRGDTNGLL